MHPAIPLVSDFAKLVLKKLDIDPGVLRPIGGAMLTAFSLATIHFATYIGAFDYGAFVFLDTWTLAGFIWQMVVVYTVVVATVKIVLYALSSYVCVFAREASLMNAAEALRRHGVKLYFPQERELAIAEFKREWRQYTGYFRGLAGGKVVESRTELPRLPNLVDPAQLRRLKLSTKVAQRLSDAAENKALHFVSNPLVHHCVAATLTAVVYLSFTGLAVVLLATAVVVLFNVGCSYIGSMPARYRGPISTTIRRTAPGLLLLMAVLSGAQRANYIKSSPTYLVKATDGYCSRSVIVVAATNGLLTYSVPTETLSFIAWDRGPIVSKVAETCS